MSWTYYDKGQEPDGHYGGSGSTHNFHGVSIVIGGGGQGGGGSLWLSGSTQNKGNPGAPKTNPGGGGGGSTGSANIGSTGSAGASGKIWLFYNHEG